MSGNNSKKDIDTDIITSKCKKDKCKCQQDATNSSIIINDDGVDKDTSYGNIVIGGQLYPETSEGLKCPSDLIDEKYDPEWQKMTITKVSNGFIVRFPDDLGTGDEIVVLEEKEDNGIDALVNLLWTVKSEMAPNLYVDIEPLDSKEDYTRYDLIEILKDVHKHFTNDDYDISQDTLDEIKDIARLM